MRADAKKRGQTHFLSSESIQALYGKYVGLFFLALFFPRCADRTLSGFELGRESVVTSALEGNYFALVTGVPFGPRRETLQAEINRANAQHSTGPKTRGRATKKCSLNALRHGLTGQMVVMPTEDLAAYGRHVHALVVGISLKAQPRLFWFKPSPTLPGDSTGPPPWKPLSSPPLPFPPPIPSRAPS